MWFTPQWCEILRTLLELCLPLPARAFCTLPGRCLYSPGKVSLCYTQFLGTSVIALSAPADNSYLTPHQWLQWRPTDQAAESLNIFWSLLLADNLKLADLMVIQIYRRHSCSFSSTYGTHFCTKRVLRPLLSEIKMQPKASCHKAGQDSYVLTPPSHTSPTCWRRG